MREFLLLWLINISAIGNRDVLSYEIPNNPVYIKVCFLVRENAMAKTDWPSEMDTSDLTFAFAIDSVHDIGLITQTFPDAFAPSEK